MEPHREKPNDPKRCPQQKRKRFRVVKLEERIAPGKGNSVGKNCATHTCFCSFNCTCPC